MYGMNVPPHGRKGWSIAGLLSLDSYGNWIGPNTLLWGGISGMAWFVDQECGLCGLAATLVVWNGQHAVNDLFGVWLRDVYQRFHKSNAS
jgi:hypothetical protein